MWCILGCFDIDSITIVLRSDSNCSTFFSLNKHQFLSTVCYPCPPLTCLHLSSAAFLSDSACSARSMAFSLSSFSICIFFLMASIVLCLLLECLTRERKKRKLRASGQREKSQCFSLSDEEVEWRRRAGRVESTLKCNVAADGLNLSLSRQASFPGGLHLPSSTHTHTHTSAKMCRTPSSTKTFTHGTSQSQPIPIFGVSTWSTRSKMCMRGFTGSSCFIKQLKLTLLPKNSYQCTFQKSFSVLSKYSHSLCFWDDFLF